MLAKDDGIEVDYLDLSLVTSEYEPQDPSVQELRLDRDAALPLAVQLLPEPLARRRPHDWMNEIYERWTLAAHAVVIVTPVHWYQSPSAAQAR